MTAQEYKPRGPQKFPHWHDCHEWAKRARLTRSRFLAMTAEEFADFCQTAEARAFHYANRWPEGLVYCHDRDYVINIAHPGYLKHLQNWNPALIDTAEEETK